MRAFFALLVLGILAVSACVELDPKERAKQALSCKCDAGVVRTAETGVDVTYECDDALCPGMVGFECWQRTCNFVSIGKATGDVKRFDGKCCPEPSDGGGSPGGGPGPVQPPAGGECASDSDCVPATCCHPADCTSNANAPDCSDRFCTMECAPGTLDCGQGKCVCDSGSCRTDVWG